MATLTIPDKLYARLQAVAASQQRSVDDYLIDVIEKAAPDDTPSNGTRLTRDEEQLRIREVMKDLIWSQEDIDAFFDDLDLPEMSDEEAERIVAAIPPLDPPLSQTVIQMREEERY
jgi:hypothetical protein